MDYDLVVVGSGPAGEKGAARAAFFGKRVALVEHAAELGGACANTGTLPSKTLRESALYLSDLRQRDIFGVARTDGDDDLPVSRFLGPDEGRARAKRAGTSQGPGGGARAGAHRPQPRP